MKKVTLAIQGHHITMLEDNFLSLTDISKKFSDRPEILIQNWLRNRNTVELMGLWETMHNARFNHIEFEVIRNKTGLNAFAMSVSDWVGSTQAIGIRATPGRYGGTYAHRDLALEYCSWLSPAFRLYMNQEFQRLKAQENPEWEVRRSLAKVNYELHAGAIRKHIVPAMKGSPRVAAITALTEEADMLNLAIFGITAAQWRSENPELVAKGMNIRDTADIYQLLVLANMESYNETLIHYQMSKEERFYELEKAAHRQLEALYNMNQLPVGLVQSPNLPLEDGSGG